MFLGFIPVGSPVNFWLTTKLSNAPTSVDAATTINYRIYGESPTAPMQNGTGTIPASVVDAQTGFYAGQRQLNASDGYTSGQTYFVKFTYTLSGTVYASEATFVCV